MILLDTDIMVDLLRQYPPAVAWLDSLGDEEVLLPGFVVMELIQGCRSKAEQEKVEKALADYGVAWPLPETCEKASSAFSCYHLTHGLGIMDALIGQMAVDLGVPLFTYNQKHYEPILNLRSIQPYERDTQQ